MEPVALLVLNVANVIAGVVIAIRRRRWVAVPLCLFVPVFGWAFALMLKVKCPHCAEYHNPGAAVCPKCGHALKRSQTGERTARA